MAKIGRKDADDGFQFLDWLALSVAARTPWKLSDYYGGDNIATAATKRLKDEFGVSDPRNYVSLKKKDSVPEGDWLLQFEYDYKKEKVSGDPEWMIVDFVAPFNQKRPDPFQAIQAHPTRSYGRPPFPLTSEFKKAFRAAVSELKERSFDRGGWSPSKLLLNEIADRLRP